MEVCVCVLVEERRKLAPLLELERKRGNGPSGVEAWGLPSHGSDRDAWVWPISGSEREA